MNCKDTLRNDARYSSSTRSIAQNYFYISSISRFREREGYAWILYPDCVSCTVYFINRSMSPSYFTLANDRITLCTLSYEIRRHLARRLRSGYKNFVESIQSRLWRTIRILFEGRRNESVDRECDERVRRALRNRGERGRWWLEKEEPSARRDRFA